MNITDMAAAMIAQGFSIEDLKKEYESQIESQKKNKIKKTRQQLTVAISNWMTAIGVLIDQTPNEATATMTNISTALMEIEKKITNGETVKFKVSEDAENYFKKAFERKLKERGTDNIDEFLKKHGYSF